MHTSLRFQSTALVSILSVGSTKTLEESTVQNNPKLNSRLINLIISRLIDRQRVKSRDSPQGTTQEIQGHDKKISTPNFRWALGAIRKRTNGRR
ncbi:hypothetical protein BJX63DRAFT_379064 [Aspergillus granulosus]|uniref:Uncharacterized protein n=1 Tax=Aspergillus granulosus TaxID=176169 RepID=A0ABR4HZV5_9EURO